MTLPPGGRFGFARLWFATGVTALGVQTAQLALPLLAVTTLRMSPAQVGFLGAAQWAPFLVIALPLGVLVDRRRRRPLLIAAELVRAAATLGIVGLAGIGLLSPLTLLLLAFVVGCGTVLFEVAYQSFLPSTVPVEGLEAANSRLQATEATVRVGGPAVGGVLVQVLGAVQTLGVTVLGSVLSAIALAGIPEPRVGAGRPRQPVLREVGEGVAFLLHDRVLAGLLGFSAISNPFAQWVLLLFIVDAVRRLHLEAGQVGLVLAIGALGTLAGAAVAPALDRRYGPLRIIVLSAAVDPLALLALPAADASWPIGVVIGVVAAALAVNGFAVGVSDVVVTTLRQTRTPDGLRGRVNAANRMVSYGTISLGAAAAGVAAGLLGARGGLLAGCLGAQLTIVWVGLWARSLSRRPEGEPLVGARGQSR